MAAITRYVFDSSALLRWFDEGPGAARVEEIIFQAGAGYTRIAVSAVNWGEVYYVIARKKNEAQADSFSEEFRNLPIEITTADYSRAERAGTFRNKHSLLMRTHLPRLWPQANAPR